MLPPRWCACNLLPPVETGLAVHVLLHHAEQSKPSSTGRLVARSVHHAECHTYHRESGSGLEAILGPLPVGPDREPWILHPHGEPFPAQMPTDADLASSTPRRKILLLDGTWRQAGEMLRAVEGMGRCVRLPDTGDQPSRFWLRRQASPARFSTAEALMSVFRWFAEHDAERRLRLHFELHVWATLLARGRREMADRYIRHSPLLATVPDVVDRLLARERTRRSSVAGPDQRADDGSSGNAPDPPAGEPGRRR